MARDILQVQAILLKKLIRLHLIPRGASFGRAQTLMAAILARTTILTRKERNILSWRILRVKSLYEVADQYRRALGAIHSIENRALLKITEERTRTTSKTSR